MCSAHVLSTPDMSEKVLSGANIPYREYASHCMQRTQVRTQSFKKVRATPVTIISIYTKHVQQRGATRLLLARNTCLAIQIVGQVREKKYTETMGKLVQGW
jgi:hypothetical protein